jgi:hypothetical protein
MVNLKELMYRVYRVQRDYIAQVRTLKMDYNEFLFLQKLNAYCDDHDSRDMEFFDRWIKEREDDI